MGDAVIENVTSASILRLNSPTSPQSVSGKQPQVVRNADVLMRAIRNGKVEVLSAPYEIERREMRQESDAELLKVRATGNEWKKELAQKELQHREHARNVQTDRRIAKWTVVVSIIALVVSIIAIVVSAH